MSDFLRTAFNRRFVSIPIIAAIVLITVVSYETETRRSELMSTASKIRDAQERMRILADLGYAAADVESEGRGYLLTRNSQFLEPYDQATARIAKSLKELDLAYQRDTREAQQIEQIEQLISRKLIESRATLEAVRADGNAPDFIKQLRTVEGLFWMKEIRQRIELLRDQERQNVYSGVESWREKHQEAGTVNVLSAIISAILLVITGVFITRDIERRNAAVHELDKVVEQRTRELSELSTHLQGVTEREKSQLARELHDELGGLLVSMKMDLMQLGKKLDLTHPDVKARWQRIQDAIGAGVELKRRVIEELRPTLLDNMGLIAALSWQAEQTCSRAGIALQTCFPEEEPNMNTDMSIAVFRVAQEAFTNLVKHSHASMVRISLRFVGNELLLTIEDNGVGLPRQYTPRVGSHGLLSMRHRIEAIGGTFSIGPATPRGTQVLVRVPIKLQSGDAASDSLALRA